jgi:glycosyltransferase involved in cell wall biosynthesis
MTHFYFSPLKIFEFFSLGLPVVSSAQGQVAELIPHRERGYLYAPGDPEDLAQGIAHLLENREEALRLGQAGRDWVLSHATWEKRVGEILSRIGDLS